MKAPAIGILSPSTAEDLPNPPYKNLGQAITWVRALLGCPWTTVHCGGAPKLCREAVSGMKDIRFGTCSMAPGCSRALRQTWITQNYARNIKKPTEAETRSKQKAVCPSSFCIVPHWKEQLWCLALLSSSLCLSLTICCHETKLGRNAWQCLKDFKSGFFGPFMRFDVRHESKSNRETGRFSCPFQSLDHWTTFNRCVQCVCVQMERLRWKMNGETTPDLFWPLEVVHGAGWGPCNKSGQMIPRCSLYKQIAPSSCVSQFLKSVQQVVQVVFARSILDMDLVFLMSANGLVLRKSTANHRFSCILFPSNMGVPGCSCKISFNQFCHSDFFTRHCRLHLWSPPCCRAN